MDGILQYRTFVLLDILEPGSSPGVVTWPWTGLQSICRKPSNLQCQTRAYTCISVRNQIPEPVVKSVIEKGKEFVVFEDGYGAKPTRAGELLQCINLSRSQYNCWLPPKKPCPYPQRFKDVIKTGGQLTGW